MRRHRLPAPSLARLIRDGRGASSVEYGLILAFVVLMMFGALMQVGGITKDMWHHIAAQVTTSK